MRVLFFYISMLSCAISFAQSKSLVVIELDSNISLKSYMHKDYCSDSYLHKFYHKNIGNAKITIPYKVIIPMSWRFRCKKYYSSRNKNVKIF